MKLKTGGKEVHDRGDPWPHLTPWLKISHVFGTGRPTNFTVGIRIEYADPHHRHERWPASSWWLFKSPLVGGGGILWRPHYRPHSSLDIARNQLKSHLFISGTWPIGHKR